MPAASVYSNHSIAVNHGTAYDSQLSTCTGDGKLTAAYMHSTQDAIGCNWCLLTVLMKVFQLL